MSTPPATASRQASTRVEIVVWGIQLDDAATVRQVVDAWDAWDAASASSTRCCTAPPPATPIRATPATSRGTRPSPDGCRSSSAPSRRSTSSAT